MESVVDISPVSFSDSTHRCSIFQFEGYKYDPELIFCDLGHVAQSASRGAKTLAAVFPSVLLVEPFLMIAFLNRLVYKTTKNQVEALGHRQLG